MSLLSDIKEIKAAGVEVVIRSPLSLKLLKVYSKLYLGGKPPKCCAAAQRNYYEQILKDGEMKAKSYKERTCVPNWKGLKYSHIMGGHLSDEYITDEQANKALAYGALRKVDFTKLPEDHDEFMEAFEAKKKADAEAKAAEAAAEVIETKSEIDEDEIKKSVILAFVKAQGNITKLTNDAIEFIIGALNVEITEEDNTKAEKVAKIESFILGLENEDEDEEEEIIIE